MKLALPHRAERSFLAPEVIQTSAMDCGPAALKCLLEGYRKNASYGRLREACQTDIDGTSIDVIETVANQLGLDAAQEMIPADHFVCEPDKHLPAMIVLRRADGTPHFAIAWRRIGSLLQMMDPATGRRWSDIADVMAEAWQHQMSVAAQDWRHWAGSDDFLAPLRTRLASLFPDRQAIENTITRAIADQEWFALGALDACTRFVQSMISAGGIAKGAQAQRLLVTLFEQTIANGHDIFSRVPEHYWSISPDRKATDPTRQNLVMRGIVLLRVKCVRAGHIDERSASVELQAAMTETPVNAPAYLWDALKADGLLAPLVLVSALGVSALATVIEALLARGLFDISSYLNLGSQRLAGAIAILVFVVLTLLLRIPINTEAMRIGRAFDARLRMALLAKIPNLSDRYFQSRPISDMADRGHMLHMLRLLPGRGVHFVQLAFELLLTLVGLLLIDAQSGLIAIVVAAIAIAVPLATQSLVSERDLRVRTQSAALSGFYLDALLGIAPIKAHRAQRAIEHRHEALLSEWTDSNRAMIRTMLTTAGFQSFFCFGLTGLLLVEHFVRLRGVTGADLLLVFWAMKLPSIGGTIASLAHQYPSTRNILLRLLEPLNAPEQIAPKPLVKTNTAGGISVLMDNVSVVQSGHTILRDVSLSIRAGEHIALIGPSGAGKSTLLGLMLGWNRPASGAFFIDGIPSEQHDMKELRQQVAWIDPAVQLWNTSLMDNLTFACREAEQANVAEAVNTAQLRSVLENLPGGYQAALGEGGALLSGGEGQRVRFARALLQPQTRLAVLDEPFRGLDRARRTELLQRVRRHWENVTLLCATHDIAETQAFDRVVIIENGRIVENDVPSRLAARPSRYRALLDAERTMQGQLGMANTPAAQGNWRRLIVDHATVQEATSGRENDAAIMRLVRKAP